MGWGQATASRAAATACRTARSRRHSPRACALRCRDEQNLEENEKIKAELAPTKINEPKTPYLSPMETEDEADLGGHGRGSSWGGGHAAPATA